MTGASVPDPAAVRIAAEVIYRETSLAMASPDLARAVVIALAGAGLLAGPGELAALRAVAEAARRDPHTGLAVWSALADLDTVPAETAAEG